MPTLTWDGTGQRLYETGVDRGVLYQIDSSGVYTPGVPWNGLVSVTAAPSGADPQKHYADNINYITLMGAEEFGVTIEAFTYPADFAKNDGQAAPSAGLSIGGQARKPFGLSWRSRVGNDVAGDSHGYKLHLAYGLQATPSEKQYQTINDSPEPITFSWEATSTPVYVNANMRPTSYITLDSTKITPAKMQAVETLIWGPSGAGSATLPTPQAVITAVAN